jgi:hypothetical protein
MDDGQSGSWLSQHYPAFDPHLFWGGTSATLRILGLTSDQAVTGNFEGHGVI